MRTERTRGWPGAAVLLIGTVACGDPTVVAEVDAPAGSSSSGVTDDDDGAATTTPPTVPDAGPGGGSSSSGGATGSDDGEPVRVPDDDPPRPPAPAFVDVTAQAGLDVHPGPLVGTPACILDDHSHPHQTGNWCIPERFLGAAAVADFDDDGALDVYLTRKDGPDRLMQGDGRGGFVDVAAERGLVLDEASGAAAWLDADDDGDLDLLVTTFGGSQHHLYIAGDDGTFTDEGSARGLPGTDGAPIAGTGIGVGDFDLDGYVDVFVAEWRPLAQMGPGSDHSRLLRNRGAEAPGFFEDVTAQHGIALDQLPPLVDIEDGVYSFAPAFVDLDDDGWPELTLTGDFSTTRLYWNEMGSLVDGTWTAGVGSERNGMGSTFGDIDGDGDLDWFVSAIAAEGLPDLGHRLYRYEGGRQFSEAQDEYGIREPGWGWSASLFDYDLDGDLDLAMASGWDALAYDDDPPNLWENGGAPPLVDRATELGIVYPGQGRGLVTFDYDDDGDLDILLVGNSVAPALFRNDAAAGHWLKVRAQGTVSNRLALGAVVRVWPELDDAPLVHHIGAGGDHLYGQAPPIAHFGLGQLQGTVARVTVTWPMSGTVHEYLDVAPDTTLDVIE